MPLSLLLLLCLLPFSLPFMLSAMVWCSNPRHHLTSVHIDIYEQDEGVTDGYYMGADDEGGYVDFKLTEKGQRYEFIVKPDLRDGISTSELIEPYMAITHNCVEEAKPRTICYRIGNPRAAIWSLNRKLIDLFTPSAQFDNADANNLVGPGGRPMRCPPNTVNCTALNCWPPKAPMEEE